MRSDYTAILTVTPSGYRATCPEAAMTAEGATQTASVEALNALLRPQAIAADPRAAAHRFVITAIVTPDHCSPV